MTQQAVGDRELVPIDEVAQRLGLRASAIRYYEQRGLLRPGSRQGAPLVWARGDQASRGRALLAAIGADEPR